MLTTKGVECSKKRNKHQRFLDAARAVALTSNGVGGRRRNSFRLGAILVHKSVIVEVATNDNKTHPLLLKYTKFPFLHAESACIIKRGLEHCDGLYLYVVRVKKNNENALARPCKSCYTLIQDVGITFVIYSVNENIFTVLNIKKELHETMY